MLDKRLYRMFHDKRISAEKNILVVCHMICLHTKRVTGINVFLLALLHFVLQQFKIQLSKTYNIYICAISLP